MSLNPNQSPSISPTEPGAMPSKHALHLANLAVAKASGRQLEQLRSFRDHLADKVATPHFVPLDSLDQELAPPTVTSHIEQVECGEQFEPDFDGFRR